MSQRVTCMYSSDCMHVFDFTHARAPSTCYEKGNMADSPRGDSEDEIQRDLENSFPSLYGQGTSYARAFQPVSISVMCVWRSITQIIIIHDGEYNT